MKIRIVLASLSLLAFAAAGAACSSAPSTDDAADQGAEQDMSKAAKELVGSWTIDASSAGLSSTIAYDFRPDGTFFRDSKRVLNGVFLPGAPPPMKRETGTFTVSKSKGLLTLHITSPAPATEVLAYVYTPAKILNGLFLPDAAPPSGNATLALTEQPPPMSMLAFPTITYDHADSYCTSASDCSDERADGTWTPPGAAGFSTCNTATSTCQAGCLDVVLCMKGSHWDTTTCSCAPDAAPPPCVDNVACMVDAHWDATACKCVPNL